MDEAYFVFQLAYVIKQISLEVFGQQGLSAPGQLQCAWTFSCAFVSF